MIEHKVTGEGIAEFTAQFIETMAEQRRFMTFENRQEIVDRVTDTAMLIHAYHRKWDEDKLRANFSEMLVLCFLLWDLVIPELELEIREFIAEERSSA